MLSWSDLIDICELQLPDIPGTVFERCLIDLAEPEFARITECIDDEYTVSTVDGDNDYEIPVGVVRIKSVEYRGIRLTEIKEDNLNVRDQYQEDGTTLRTGTPTRYYTKNNFVILVPTPTLVKTMRMRYSVLPEFAKRRYIAQVDTSTTEIYLNLRLPILADDGVTFTNVTRTLTGVCSGFSETDNRYKYTVATMAAQVAGDIIELSLSKYMPSIPEIHVPKLIPYALSMGYGVRGDVVNQRNQMGIFESDALSVKNERAGRAYPKEAVTNVPIIR